MVDAVASRRFRHEGKLYQEGDTLDLKVQQLNDFEKAGLATRAPKKSKSEDKAD